MSEHTDDPTPLHPLLGDTPGPEATPEQDAAVTSLLGLLRGDDLAMPDDVVRRLDAVLAEERRSPLVPPADASAAGVLLDGESQDETGHGTGATVTVLPTDRAARHAVRGGGPSFGLLKVLGGVAAAVVLVAGGVSVLLHHDGTSATATAASAAPSSAAEGSAAAFSPETVMRATGTTYTKATLSTQVDALLTLVQDDKGVAVGSTAGQAPASPATPSRTSNDASAPVVPAASPTAVGTGTSNGAATSGDGTQASAASAGPLDARAQRLTAGNLGTCLVALTGRPGVVPLAVDHGTWEGAPADVLVLPTEDDPSTLDVYVIAPGCTSEATVQVREYAVIPRP
jgi:hypothetical protein